MRQACLKIFLFGLFLINSSPAIADSSFDDNGSRMVLYDMDKMPNLRQSINIAAEVADSSAKKKKKEKDNSNGDGSNRFTAGASEFGMQMGWGAAVDIPPRWPRTNWEFAYVFPNYKYNLTGIVGNSFYRGTWSWMAEAGFVEAYHPAAGYVVGFSPLMVEYKFVQPNARIIPYVFGGAGFAYTDWNEKSFQREIATNFEFLLHLGAGVEFYKTKQGALSLNYRFFHISNAGIEFPNIGINANVVTLGYSFF
ncbi:MAG: hypothetical protein A3K09_06235 [Nitrospinae bacterium RIFCSPLOWO2_12_FULL_47_7]|nr:MAG: hypothetical protein A3K09_06235 [Nitrospinae bacterium RIFCSPLOWO2_12_FULL_47_7]